VVEVNWVGAGEKDNDESPPTSAASVPARGVGSACRALAGPSRPGATLQNPARLHRGTCRADCFSQPPRVGVVHERGGDGRSNGQRGKAARARLPDREGMEQVPVSRPFCFSCALCLDAGRVSEVSSTPHG